MAIALRIIWAFIVSVIFVGIVFSTFFTSPQYLSISKLSPTKWTSEMEGIFSQGVSDFNFFYSDNELDMNVFSSIGWEHDVNISRQWKYLSSFRSIGERSTFSGTGFVITQEGVWEIFFDTVSTPWKVFVYSINTPVTLSLMSDDSAEKYVDIHLTPHMYIEFKANRGRDLKNADRIRIGTVFKLGYLGAPGVYSEGEEYIKKYFESEDDFLSTISSYIAISDQELHDLLYTFSQQSVSQMPGYDMIQRYITLFVNDEKKVVFYKNKVLEWYLKMLKIESMDKKISIQTNKDLQKLKSLNLWAYNELTELQEKIITALYASSEEQFTIPKLLFSFFLDEELIDESWYFPLYGFSLFNIYDRSNTFSYELSRKFLQSFPVYVESLNITDIELELRYDYFLYYLEKQLLYLFNTDEASKNITSLIVTFENYANTTLRHDDYSKVARVSRLFVFSDILKNIDTFLRSKYFLVERDQSGLLVLHPGNTMTVKNVIDLKTNIWLLYDTYDKDKKYLDDTSSRDVWIISNIIETRDKIDEYLLALANYEEYKTEYDISKTSLLSLDTFSQGDDNTPTLDKIRTYLWQFIWISSLEIPITIEDGIYYKIEKLNISGTEFSFHLFPSPEYKMTDIKIDGVKKPIQYKLWNIKQDWREQYKTAPDDQRHLFDFSRFFLLTFFQKDDINIEEFITTTNIQEDKTEIVFKKDILLWNPWEFTTLKDYLNIEYKDITLEKSGKNYKIFLGDIDFVVPIMKEGWENKIYRGILQSEYVLNSTDHYFKWVSLQIYRDHDDIKKGMLFNDKPILIGWKIHITDMEDVLKALMQQVTFYTSIYGELNSIQGIQDISLQYMVFNDKLSIKLASQEKKYTILLRSWELESIYKWISKVGSWDTPLSDIKNYIE
jgi:hypothetical protein